MKSERILIFALVLSLLIHAALFFLNFKTKDEKDKKNEQEPVEVSIVPKEKPQEPRLPQPPVQEPPPPDDNSKSTLDENVHAGAIKGVPMAEQPERNKTSSRKLIPEHTDDMKPQQGDIATAKSKPLPNPDGLLDTKDVVSEFANSKNTNKAGEDTASYSVFQDRYESYFSKFKRRVYQVWTYPQTSVMRGETGVVHVSFSILKDGAIVNIKMIESSGYPALDREVMRVLKTIGGIPLPESYNLEQLNVDDAYFIYTIGGGIERYIR